MSTFLIISATSQPSRYPLVLTRLGGLRSRPNTHLKYMEVPGSIIVIIIIIIITIIIIIIIKLKKIKSVAYSSQGSQTGQLDFCN